MQLHHALVRAAGAVAAARVGEELEAHADGQPALAVGDQEGDDAVAWEGGGGGDLCG